MARSSTLLAVLALTGAVVLVPSTPAVSAVDPEPPAPVAEPDVQAERTWTSAFAGNAGNGSATVHDDGSVTLAAVDGKIAESEDGFLYYYTEVDASTENFTLTATFHVDEASAVDNQGGYGIIAVDSFEPGSKNHRYFNSAASAFARQTDPVTGAFHYGTPGGRFVSGYTEPSDVASTARSMRDSAAFDRDFKADLQTPTNTNPPKIEEGDTHTLTLRRSSTGFHAWMDGAVEDEVIAYSPEMLEQQSTGTITVGVFVGRKLTVTASDITLTTVHPDDDDPATERPWTVLEPDVRLASTATTSASVYDAWFTSALRGHLTLLRPGGEVVAEGLPVEKVVPTVVPVPLDEGTNHLTAVFTPLPAAEQDLGDHVRLSSEDPVRREVSIDVRRYGVPGDALHVAPDGSPDGLGTREHPLDVATAVAYAQPGQQVVARGGTYRPTSKILVDRGNDGRPGEEIWFMSAPGELAVFDLSASPDGGFDLRGDHWHFYDLEVTGAQGRQKAFAISGHHNVVERLHTHHNGNTGLQITGYDTEPRSMWPSDNLVLSSESHHNMDPQRNDADGFAAKLTVGPGNVFRYCISHHNVDDGFDLYAKSTLGPHGPVRIEHSVAYRNGYLTDDPDEQSPQSGKGFKLGGESIPLMNELHNSVAWHNVTQGVASNSSPDAVVTDVTTYDNHANNLTLSTSTHPTTDYRVSGFLSAGPRGADVVSLRGQDDTVRTATSNYLDGRNVAGTEVEASWFTSVDTTVRPTIADDGSVDLHGLLELTDAAPADTGARLLPNPVPTVVVVGPEPGAGTEPVEPVDPVEPTEPTEPADPEIPGSEGPGSVQPGQPSSEPVEPADPTAPTAVGGGAGGAGDTVGVADETAAADGRTSRLAATGTSPGPAVAGAALLVLGASLLVLRSARHRRG